MDNNEWKENLLRQWKRDFPSLKVEEINSLLVTLFYQLFLIELDDVDFRVMTDENGMRVSFDLVGYCYKDPGARQENKEG